MLNRIHAARLTALVAVPLLLTYLASLTWATSLCPFCSALNLTFAQQMNKSDIVVIAKVTNIPKPSDDIDAPLPRASFEITQVLKGERFVAPEMKFDSLLVGTYKIGEEFLVMGSDPPAVIWTTPMRATERVIDYVGQLNDLPEEGAERLEFFQDYFEDSESVLAFDAYDEFAGAPYEVLVELKDAMPREKLIAWIKDPETAVNRRRLYFVMLGVCGTENEIEFLEELIKSGDRTKQAGLDSLLACYLNLKKEAGVDLVEATFIADKEVDYVDTLAAVSALRFHGTEVDFIPKERIVAAIRQLLERPKMADMIIPDLARWEDWTVMDKLVQMFKDADDETNWLRVPVISYLKACPNPIAKKHIEELRKIDPDAVRRAEFYADFENFDDSAIDDEEGWGEETGSEPNSDSDAEADKKKEAQPAEEMKAVEPESTDLQNEQQQAYVSTVAQDEDANPNTADLIPANIAPEENSQAIETVSNSMAAPPEPAPEETTVAQSAVQSAPLAQATTSYNYLTWPIIFVPMLFCGAIFVLLWSVIHGWFERLIF